MLVPSTTYKPIMLRVVVIHVKGSFIKKPTVLNKNIKTLKCLKQKHLKPQGLK
jgi:hypothetical protein